MGKLIVITAGSNENLAASCVLRFGLSRMDSLLAIYSKSSREPVEKTLALIKDLAGKAGVGYRDIAVSGVYFTSDIKEIVKALTSEPKQWIHVCMAGGSWMLIVEVLAAISVYTRFMDGSTAIFGVADDGLHEVIVPFSLIMPVALTSRELKALKVIKSKGITEASSTNLVKTLMHELGVSRTRVYKILNKLLELGVLEVKAERSGRGRDVKPSDVGNIILELL